MTPLRHARTPSLLALALLVALGSGDAFAQKKSKKAPAKKAPAVSAECTDGRHRLAHVGIWGSCFSRGGAKARRTTHGNTKIDSELK